MDVVKRWFQRYFSDPQVVILVSIIVIASVVIYSVGNILAPVLTSLVVAYLLQGPIKVLERIGIPSFIALTFVYIIFLAVMIFVLAWLIPELIFQQIPKFFKLVPDVIKELTTWLEGIGAKYPGIISNKTITTIIDKIDNAITQLGGMILESSWGSVKAVVSVAVFIVLVPMLVFFFLKDKQDIIDWVRSYFPKNIDLTSTVWHDLNTQIGNYIRGKIFEIMVVWIATYIGFYLLDMPVPLLLAGMVGLSVLIPYIGAVVVTIPVVLIAYGNFHGFTPEFWWVIGVYAVIQTIDGVVIVPLLFSEVVQLHPIAIVVAVLVFGGLWGFWGVFFAIPLASLVQAILNAWPRKEAEPVAGTE